MAAKECYEKPCALKYSALKGLRRILYNTVYTVFVGLWECCQKNSRCPESRAVAVGNITQSTNYSSFAPTQHHTSLIWSEERCWLWSGSTYKNRVKFTSDVLRNQLPKKNNKNRLFSNIIALLTRCLYCIWITGYIIKPWTISLFP